MPSWQVPLFRQGLLAQSSTPARSHEYACIGHAQSWSCGKSSPLDPATAGFPSLPSYSPLQKGFPSWGCPALGMIISHPPLPRYLTHQLNCCGLYALGAFSRNARTAGPKQQICATGINKSFCRLVFAFMEMKLLQSIEITNGHDFFEWHCFTPETNLMDGFYRQKVCEAIFDECIMISYKCSLRAWRNG